MSKEKFKHAASLLLFELRLFFKECLLPAAILCLIIEGLSRRSLWKPFVFLATRPHLFLYNTLLIAISLSLCFLFKRRRFALFFISSLWLIIGVTDFILLMFRTTPFTAVDFLLLDSAFSIMRHYLSIPSIVLICVGLCSLAVLGVFLFRKAKKAVEGTKKLVASIMILSVLLFGLLLTRVFLFTGLLERNFGNLAQSYHNNGFPFCFYASIFGTGISKPATYSDKEINRILNSLTTPSPKPPTVTNAPATTAPTPTVPPKQEVTPILEPPTPTVSPTQIVPTTAPSKADTDQPNFIFLQLESFFNPNLIVGSRYSKNPIPNFERFLSECPSGYLSVPSVGAGTANTEFEVLTGMNLDFFGPGEYPYKTVLKDTTCESIAYNLSALGLSTHAIHNNDGTFYERHKVFSQLGFDTFTPIEYMGSYDVTPLGWPKDDMLTSEIMKALKSTDTQDLVYTISVQGHGSYPSKILIDDPEIAIRDLPDDLQDSYYGLQYLVNQLYEMDAFLLELTEALSAFDEKVVLVAYGDHLPSFPFTEELLTNENLFQTQYIIWNNYENREPVKKDLEAYALTSYVLSQNDVHEGLFTKFHQTHSGSDTYLEDMEMLEYDVLYGPLSSYNGVLPYTATKLRFGTDTIALTNVLLKQEGDHEVLYVIGTNFTPYSIVYVNGKPRPTTQLSKKALSVTDFSKKDTMVISVAQVGTDSIPLSFTNSFTINSEGEILSRQNGVNE